MEEYEEAHREAIEEFYKGVFDVIERTTATDPETKQEQFVETVIYSNQKCRLSDLTLPVTGANEAPTLDQKKKLFCAPELKIPAGSKIVVTQNGVTTAFHRSSEPTVHESHQEIILDIFKNWA